MPADLFDQLADNAWTLPAADGSANLHVTELGAGPPVVTLHGGPGAHFAYLVDAVRPALHHARFVLFDQRGGLLSPVPAVQIDSLTTAQLVADLERLRLALGQDRLRLLGHSWGSLLAQLYYLTHPDRVAGLILTGAMWPFSPPPSYETEKIERQERLRNRPEVAAAIRAAGLAGDLEQLTPRQRSLRYRITGLAACSIYRIDNWRRSRSMHWNREAAIAIERSVPSAYDIRPTLQAHPVPISVIQGDHDYLDPAAAQWHQLGHSHPSVDVTVIEQAGHNAWTDDPSAFGQALARALEHTGG